MKRYLIFAIISSLSIYILLIATGKVSISEHDVTFNKKNFYLNVEKYWGGETLISLNEYPSETLVTINCKPTTVLDIIWSKESKKVVAIFILDVPENFESTVIDKSISIYDYINSNDFYGLYFNNVLDGVMVKEEYGRKFVHL